MERFCFGLAEWTLALVAVSEHAEDPFFNTFVSLDGKIKVLALYQKRAIFRSWRLTILHPSRDDNDLDFFICSFGGLNSPWDMLFFCSSVFLQCTISRPVPVSGAALLVGHGGEIFYGRN